MDPRRRARLVTILLCDLFRRPERPPWMLCKKK